MTSEEYIEQAENLLKESAELLKEGHFKFYYEMDIRIKLADAYVNLARLGIDLE